MLVSIKVYKMCLSLVTKSDSQQGWYTSPNTWLKHHYSGYPCMMMSKFLVWNGVDLVNFGFLVSDYRFHPLKQVPSLLAEVICLSLLRAFACSSQIQLRVCKILAPWVLCGNCCCAWWWQQCHYAQSPLAGTCANRQYTNDKSHSCADKCRWYGFDMESLVQTIVPQKTVRRGMTYSITKQGVCTCTRRLRWTHLCQKRRFAKWPKSSRTRTCG